MQKDIELNPIVEEIERADNDLDFQKPLSFTEIWHNTNKFQVVFTRECTSKAQKCESCKVEFAHGGVVCIPQDILMCHMERFFYPKKDANGKIQMNQRGKRISHNFVSRRNVQYRSELSEPKTRVLNEPLTR